jgi:SAM-dependent methyltransferase
MKLTAQTAVRCASPISGLWLEIGCGPGNILPTISSLASIFVGIDVDAEVIEDAAVLSRFMRGAVVVTRASAYHLPFKDGFFDGILCLETLEHLDENKALPEMLRVLKPGGRLVFSVPIEVGASLAVRQLFRYLIGLRDPSWRPMPYSLTDFFRLVLKLGDLKLHVTVRSPSPYTHLYFSHRALLMKVKQHFVVERTLRSPISLPGPWGFSLVAVGRKPNGPNAVPNFQRVGSLAGG